ncbi:hypothetical protein [Streptomyces sp. NPDC006668]|uniref:hypothetical protein n=1 Tax=Streptomyces sp. NPDC006668 TaxID=3156903 RepID=UPI0033CF4495
MNIFLIGFASMGGRIAGELQSDDQPPAPPPIAQGLGQPAGSGTGSRSTSPTPLPAATATGAWSAADGALTVTVVNGWRSVAAVVKAHVNTDHLTPGPQEA